MENTISVPHASTYTQTEEPIEVEVCGQVLKNVNTGESFLGLTFSRIVPRILMRDLHEEVSRKIEGMPSGKFLAALPRQVGKFADRLDTRAFRPMVIRVGQPVEPETPFNPPRVVKDKKAKQPATKA